MEKRNLIKTFIGGIVFFLISWIATDIMDHQTFFTPHEILSPLEETATSGERKPEKSTKKTTEEKEPSSIGYVTVTVSEANIREGAGKSYAVVTVAKEGETFDLVPEIRDAEDISWYEILLDGDERGFISAKICEYTPYPEEESVEETTSEDLREGLGLTDTGYDTIYLHAERLQLPADQLTEEYVESHAAEIIMLGEYHTSYQTIKLWGLKIWHFICLTLVAMVIVIIFLLALGAVSVGDSKFFGTLICILCVGGLAALLIFGIKDNTQYKYVVEKKYEIHNMESEDGICTLHYRDADVILDTTIDANKNQVLYLDEPAQITHVYKVQKKPANAWYWLTELSPRERTIYILF